MPLRHLLQSQKKVWEIGNIHIQQLLSTLSGWKHASLFDHPFLPQNFKIICLMRDKPKSQTLTSLESSKWINSPICQYPLKITGQIKELSLSTKLCCHTVKNVTKRPEIWTCLSQHSWWFKRTGVQGDLSKIPSLNDFVLHPIGLPQGLNCLNYTSVHLHIGHRGFILVVPVQQPLPRRSELPKLRRTEGRHKISSKPWLTISSQRDDVKRFALPSSGGPTIQQESCRDFFGSCYALQFQRLAAFCRLLWDRAVHWTFQSVRGCTSPSSIPQQKANMCGSQRANSPDR